MSKLSVAPKAGATPPQISILDWDATMQRDPEILARYARRAAALTNLVMAGIHAEEEKKGTSTDDFDMDLARDCAALSDLLCSLLARQLGATEEAS